MSRPFSTELDVWTLCMIGVRPVLLDLVEDVVAVLVRLGEVLDLVLGDHGQLEAETHLKALLGLLEGGRVDLLRQAVGQV